jgi:hypothetical protein
MEYRVPSDEVGMIADDDDHRPMMRPRGGDERWPKPYLCRCGEKHGRVKERFCTGLAEVHPYCVRCGGWLTDEQCRNLNEGRE